MIFLSPYIDSGRMCPEFWVHINYRPPLFLCPHFRQHFVRDSYKNIFTELLLDGDARVGFHMQEEGLYESKSKKVSAISIMKDTYKFKFCYANQ